MSLVEASRAFVKGTRGLHERCSRPSLEPLKLLVGLSGGACEMLYMAVVKGSWDNHERR